MGLREKELYTLLRRSLNLWLDFCIFLNFRNLNVDVFFITRNVVSTAIKIWWHIHIRYIRVPLVENLVTYISEISDKSDKSNMSDVSDTSDISEMSDMTVATSSPN